MKIAKRCVFEKINAYLFDEFLGTVSIMEYSIIPKTRRKRKKRKKDLKV